MLTDNHMNRRRVVALAFFAYVAWARTDGIASSFLLLGEQIRDWNLALGSWRDLPLTGTPSGAGGRGWGPAYFWVLWIGRHLVGPFAGNLPHAGGLTIAILQAIADTWLLVALMRRIPTPLAVAAALIIATQPFEVGLSAAIWNPPVAAAFAKIAVALMLGLDGSASRWRIGATVVVAWLGVQAHASGLFVAVPVFAALLFEPLLKRNWARATDVLVVIVAIVFLLEIPYGLAMLRSPDEARGPTIALESAANVAAFDLPGSFVRVTSVTGWLVSAGNDAWPFWLGTVVAMTVVVWRWRKDAQLLAVSVGPIATATMLFSTWTRPYESYWFMTLAPALVDHRQFCHCGSALGGRRNEWPVWASSPRSSCGSPRGSRSRRPFSGIRNTARCWTGRRRHRGKRRLCAACAPDSKCTRRPTWATCTGFWAAASHRMVPWTRLFSLMAP